jgi:hypothetical protein
VSHRPVMRGRPSNGARWAPSMGICLHYVVADLLDGGPQD